MSKYKFPIASVLENELIAIDGYKSYFYKIESVDIEQFDDSEVSSLYSRIEVDLNNLSPEHIYKFYRFNNQNFLNSSQEIPKVGLKLQNCNEPLEVFFEERDIYSDIGIYDDYVLFNGKYRRIISIKAFREDEIDQYLIPKGYDYVLNVKRISSDKAIKELDRVRTAHTSGIFKGNRDFESEGAFSQAEELIEGITHGVESIFNMELYFILSDLSLERLQEKTQSLISLLNVKGLTPYIEGHCFKKYKTGLFEIFRELIVGVRPSFKYRSIPNKTGHLKFLLPINKSSFMDDGIEFLDISNEEIFFDPFSESFKSRNMLVTGSTGGGKSVFVNKLVNSLIAKHPAVILDKGGSFKKVCLYHGGQSLEEGINPMDFKCPYYLREFILSVVDKDQFKKLERGLLLKEIKTFLEEGEDNCFFELISYLEKSFSGLSLYFEDIKEFITNKKRGLNRLLYVDIESYPKSLIAPLIIYVLEYFKAIPEQEKILVFDECWKFLKEHGEYIDECFRTFRKSGAFPIAISQGLSDFSSLSGDLYSSITNNSYLKVFFPQEYIEDKDISEFDNNRIASLQYDKGNYSECYIKTQDNKYKKIFRIVLSPLELELFHTESGQSERLFHFVKDNERYFSSNQKSIESFVRLQHGSL